MKTVVFDFDGVIHSYTSPWQGHDVIPDPPVPGIREAIKAIRDAGYRVVIISTRSRSRHGRDAMRAWLDKHDIVVDEISANKVAAIAYIDDRAIRFEGHPETLLWQIETLKPWNKQGDTQ